VLVKPNFESLNRAVFREAATTTRPRGPLPARNQSCRANVPLLELGRRGRVYRAREGGNSILRRPPSALLRGPANPHRRAQQHLVGNPTSASPFAQLWRETHYRSLSETVALWWQHNTAEVPVRWVVILPIGAVRSGLSQSSASAVGGSGAAAAAPLCLKRAFVCSATFAERSGGRRHRLTSEVGRAISSACCRADSARLRDDSVSW
jgi:hypothetical protein